MRWKLALSIVAPLIFGSVAVWAGQEKARPRSAQDPQAQSKPRQQPPPARQAPPTRAQPRQQPPQRQPPPAGSGQGQGMGRDPRGQGMGQGRDPQQARPRQDQGAQRGPGMGPGQGINRDDQRGRGQSQGMSQSGRSRPPGIYSNELPRGAQGAHPRFPARDMPRYAVPRNRPTPQPHPQFGTYGRGEYSAGWFGMNQHYFIWRPFYNIWEYRYICVPGHWEWDQWCRCWVWIRGFCNVPGHHHGPDSGFYFWFDFNPRW